MVFSYNKAKFILIFLTFCRVKMSQLRKSKVCTSFSMKLTKYEFVFIKSILFFMLGFYAFQVFMFFLLLKEIHVFVVVLVKNFMHSTTF